MSNVHRLRTTDRIFYMTVSLRGSVQSFDAPEYRMMIDVLEGSRARSKVARSKLITCGYRRDIADKNPTVRTTLTVATRYDLMYSYDQYGNGTCVPGSGGGFCPAMSYNSSTNRLTSIGSTAVGYDAAGNQLNDIWSTYEYDAEGRVKHSYSSGQWQYPMYNALGQRVEDYQGPDTLTLTYPRDIFGQRTGAFAQWPSQGWTGWNVYWSQIAGQRLNMGGASAYIDHSDAVGSTTMETDPNGAVQWDVTHYPWGGVFQEQGVRQSEVVMGLDWQVNDPLVPSATRELSSALGRWMTPDPLGGDVTNPQSLNRYGYVLNSPTTFTDPSGLDPCSDPAYYFSHAECGGPPPGDCEEYDLGDCSGNPFPPLGGYGGSSGGGAPAPPSAPPAGQPPLRGGGNGWIGPFTMDPVVVFPHSIPGGIYIGPWIIFVDSKGHVSTVNGQVLVAGGGAAVLAALQLTKHGYYFNPLDQATDPYHPGQLSFRQVFRVLCSTHLTVDQATGTVGSHTDTVNPVPLLPGIGPFAWPVTFGGHVVADMKGIVPASQVCQ